MVATPVQEILKPLLVNPSTSPPPSGEPHGGETKAPPQGGGVKEYWKVEGAEAEFDSLEAIGNAIREGKVTIPQGSLLEATRYRMTPAEQVKGEALNRVKPNLLWGGIGLGVGGVLMAAGIWLAHTFYAHVNPPAWIVATPFIAGEMAALAGILFGLCPAITNGFRAFRAGLGHNEVEPWGYRYIGVTENYANPVRWMVLGDGKTAVALPGQESCSSPAERKIVVVQTPGGWSTVSSAEVLGEMEPPKEDNG